ncbi:hypothetical protein ON058_01940 [Demequina sp. B12]|uniref:hypothetical protein n=1 Tax=Demequina sp. B12 TaxID=2992757 RepID=UPI00237B86BD|nr:hypothetical protein [Demequina sp. B12]MDE0572172.1 hypothetical protein [Demequina sp. B12]
MKIKVKTWAAAAGVSIPLLVASSITAAADDDTGHREAEEIAQLIEDVRPDDVDNGAVVPDGTGRLRGVENEISIPHTGDGAVVLTGSSEVPISVSLPGSGESARVASDNTVVFPADQGPVVAVQSDGNSARVHTVSESKSELEDLTYRFDGLTPEVNDDGSVTLVASSEDGGVQFEVGSVDAPWAADADGSPLATRYVVDGEALRQEVTTDSTTRFPVTADPAFQGDCGIVTCTIRFDRAYTKRIRDFGGSVGAMVGVLVTAAGSIGGPVGVAVAGAAGAII